MIVEGALVYSVYRFRAKKVRTAAQIHGNTRLEISWTIAAAADPRGADRGHVHQAAEHPQPAQLERRRSSNRRSTQPSPPNGKKLTICVQGRQYIWRYVYGAGCEHNPFALKLPYSYQEMVVPANTTVVLSITVDRRDPLVVGSVARGQGRRGAWLHDLHLVQGQGPALYHGQCAQLCGRQHAFMTALVDVVSPAAYQAWLDAPIAADPDRQLAGHPAALVPDTNRKPLGDCECP